MSKRKVIGWLVFLALVVFAVYKVPRVAGTWYYAEGKEHFEAGRYEEAADYFEQSAMLRPGHARTYVDRGDALLRQERYGEAEESFKKAISIGEDACAQCGLGAAYYRLGRHDEAKRAFVRAAELNPNDVCAYDWAGRMSYELTRYAEAIRSFEQVVKLQPDNIAALHYLANSQTYIAAFDAAVENYKRIIQLDPSYKDAHYQLGVAYGYLRKHRDAVGAYQQALSLDPNDSRAHYGLGLEYCALRDKTAALAQYERLQAIDPGRASLLLDKLGRK